MKVTIMNDQKSAQQSSAAAQRRGQLSNLLSYVEERAQDVLRRHGQLFPAFYALSPEGLSLYIAPSLEDREKDAHAANVRLVCAAQGAVVAALAIEAWVRFPRPGERWDLQPRPSLAPDRKEFVCLIGEALGGTCENKLLPILRDRRNRFSCLAISKVVVPQLIMGRYAPLLSHAPLTPENRVMAASLLQSRGIVIGKEPTQK